MLEKIDQVPHVSGLPFPTPSLIAGFPQRAEVSPGNCISTSQCSSLNQLLCFPFLNIQINIDFNI